MFIYCRMMTPEHSAAGRIKLAFTRSEAAAALGVSPITIDRLTRRNLLTPSRATRRPLYALSELERFLRDTGAGQPRHKQISPATAASAADYGRATPNPKTKGKRMR